MRIYASGFYLYLNLLRILAIIVSPNNELALKGDENYRFRYSLMNYVFFSIN